MAKYRNKPIIVEAESYRKGLEDGFVYKITNEHGEVRFCELYANPHRYVDMYGGKLEEVSYINTLEGRYFITPTDYIITGVKGERYPCKKDIFEMTYEEVKECVVGSYTPCIEPKEGDIWNMCDIDYLFKDGMFCLLDKN